MLYVLFFYALSITTATASRTLIARQSARYWSPKALGAAVVPLPHCTATQSECKGWPDPPLLPLLLLDASRLLRSLPGPLSSSSVALTAGVGSGPCCGRLLTASSCSGLQVADTHHLMSRMLTMTCAVAKNSLQVMPDNAVEGLSCLLSRSRAHLMAMSPAEMEAPTTQAGMQVASRAAHPRPHRSSPRRQLTPPPPLLQLQLLWTQSARLLLLLRAPAAAAAAALIRPLCCCNLDGCHKSVLIAIQVCPPAAASAAICDSVSMTLATVLPRSSLQSQVGRIRSVTCYLLLMLVTVTRVTALLPKSHRARLCQIAVSAYADAPWKEMCSPAMRIQCNSKPAFDTRLHDRVQI